MTRTMGLPNEHDVDVWLVWTSRPPVPLDELTCLLSEEEQARAARFRFAHDRDAYVATRGMLRVVLGRYLGAGPRALRFVLGPKGKPALPGEEGRVALEFNVSHTRGLALIAAATNREVGVDIEQSRPVPDMDGIVERFFAPGERAAFRSLPHAHRQVAFLRAWTLKEAYLKARGDGLTHALDRFAVTVDPDQPACLLAIDGDQREASNWSLASFTPAEGYTAAVAAPGHGWRVQVREWPSRHAGIER